MQRLDLTGEKFGKLQVIGQTESTRQWQIKWVCKCECGNNTVVSTRDLRSKHTQSCGCLHKEMMSNTHIKHGQSIKGAKFHAEYEVWRGMQDRCYNTKYKQYKDWGGRGIRICDRWMDDENGFQNFLSDVGPRPSELHTIDRYPNNDGDYEPGNVRWTEDEQNRNKRDNVWVEYKGDRKLLCDWLRHFKVQYGYVRFRLDKGMTYQHIFEGLENGDRPRPINIPTEEIVMQIFNDPRKSSDLVAAYGFDKDTIWKIKSGYSWSNLTGKEYSPERVVLTKEKILDIYNSGINRKLVAEKYGINKHTVTRIRTGKYHPDITGHVRK